MGRPGGSVEILWITDDGVRSLPAESGSELVGSDSGVLWLDIDHSDAEGLALLAKLIGPQPADLEECHVRTPVPKLHAYSDHYFSAINGLARGVDDRLYFQPIKIFFKSRLLVTVLGPISSALTVEAARRDLSVIREQLEARRLCPGSAFELLTAIRFEMLRSQEGLVTVIAAAVGDIEKRVMQSDPVLAEAVLWDLFDMRHDLQTVRTNAAQTHELYVHLIELLSSQRRLMELDLRRLNDLRHGFNHLRNTADLEREYLQEVLDLFQTRVSADLNRFVRKITAWGTIGIAWTVMVGIYGMNFTYMPELDWRFGYPVFLCLMALVGFLLAMMFRRRGWL
jgi:magnesium transporter